MSEKMFKAVCLTIFALVVMTASPLLVGLLGWHVWNNGVAECFPVPLSTFRQWVTLAVCWQIACSFLRGLIHNFDSDDTEKEAVRAGAHVLSLCYAALVIYLVSVCV